jgi:hypothetical protein
MAKETTEPFDAARAHRHFSSACFNDTWELIEKPNRSSADEEAMVLCALASLWHWTQRPDCTDQNLSIAYWQVSRTYALTGQGENAQKHAQRSLELAKDLSPFYKGYAHEAIARAALVSRNDELFAEHLAQARSLWGSMSDIEEKESLQKDLTELSTLAHGAA